MPYIKEDDRLHLDPTAAAATAAGELNFQFTQLIVRYIKRNGLSYQNINDVVGALEGAKAEFYRRIAVPYEDKKIRENGDVYHELEAILLGRSDDRDSQLQLPLVQEGG